MKIEVFYGHNSVGTAKNEGDKLSYAGSEPDSVQRLVESIMLQVNDKVGEELLSYIVNHLAGRVYAKVLKASQEKSVDVSSLAPDPTQLIADQMQGAMVAFMLDSTTAEKLALPGGIAPEELHITLAFLGDKEYLDAASKPIIANITPLLTKIAEGQHGPVIGKTTGNIKHFPANDEGLDPVYAEVQFDDLGTLQMAIQQIAIQSGAPEPTYAYTPHITLTYLVPGDTLPVVCVPELILNFSYLTLMHNGKRYDFPFDEKKDFLFFDEKIKKNEEQVNAGVLYQHFVKQLKA